MKMKRLGFVTCRKLPDLTLDDRLMIDPLNEEGYRVEPVSWTDDAVRWQDYDALVLRSTWDYHHNVRSFHTWLNSLEKAGMTVFNDIRTVRWNVDKRYLAELSAQNVPVPRTVYVDQAQFSPLAVIMEELNAGKLVIKPSVSASGDNTWLCSRNEIPVSEKRFNEALNAGARLMVQEYIEPIETEGEWSLMFFAGVFSHAVIKRPRPGEFRVQEQFGGSTQRAHPQKDLIEQAGRILHVSGKPALYARVDGVFLDGVFVLLELELVEPSLFLQFSEDGPRIFAHAIRTALRS